MRRRKKKEKIMMMMVMMERERQREREVGANCQRDERRAGRARTQFVFAPTVSPI